MTDKRKCLVGVSYDRVSTFDQAYNQDGTVRDDGSNESQQHRCLAYIENKCKTTKLDFKIIEHLSDRAYSGKDTNRPDYKRMLRLIASGKIDFIVTAELSRLSRSVMDFLELVRHCEKNNVRLYILGLDLDSSTPVGRVIVVILVALAQFERELTATRVRENALSRLIKDGKINGAREMLGLVRDPNRAGHFILDPEGVQVAETILKLFAKVSSKKKLLEIAKDMGLKGPGGSELTASLIDTTLEGVKHRYRGQWPINQSYLKGKGNDTSLPEFAQLPHGQVIKDTNLLDAVQAKIEDTNQKHKRAGKDGYVYMLSNILKYEDGTGFAGQCAKSGAYRYYFCSGKKLRIHADEIDNLVIRQFKEHFGDDRKFQTLLNKAIRSRLEQLPELERVIRTKDQEIAEIEAKEVGLGCRLIEKEGSFDQSFVKWLSEQVEAVQLQKAKLIEDKGRLESQRQDMLDHSGLTDMRQAIGTYLGQFSKLTGVQRRNFIEQIIESVIVKSDNTIEIRFLGRPEIGGSNQRKQSSDKEGTR